MSNMGTIARNTQKYGNAERMETGDGKSAVHKCSIFFKLFDFYIGFCHQHGSARKATHLPYSHKRASPLIA